ncbi:hypothetical protein Ciccas_010650 [Cichlidogyrus casuarinus]|uniref:ERAP1-like C-terminal domain-containing protein n=1 Tax=Cichlidogyrus casuarinus TaxID=1844966 RepID=A0ABD2PU39_9PLAT
MGYPVVKITADGCTLKFCQQRFLSDGSQDSGEFTFELNIHQIEGYSWPIPLKLIHSKDQAMTHFIDPKESSSNVVQIPSLDGLLVNPGRLSFVRVHYSGQLLNGINKMIQTGQLGPRDRLAIIDDQISLAFTGQLPISELIDLMSAYVGESHHIVWDSLYFGMSHIQLLLEEAKIDHAFDSCQVTLAIENFHKLYQKMAEPVLNKITWDAIPGEEGNDTLLRPMIITILGKTGYKPVVEEAKARFSTHVDAVLKSGQESNQIVPDLRKSIYATCMRHGNEGIFDALLQLYEKSTMADEKMKLLLCLGLPSDLKLRQRAIDFNMSDAVRKQDRYATFTGFYSASAESRRDLWNFVKENIKSLPDDLGSQSLLSHVCSISCSGFAHFDREKEVQAFWDANPMKCKMAIKQSIEEIKIKASQLARDGQNLIDKLCDMTQ